MADAFTLLIKLAAALTPLCLALAACLIVERVFPAHKTTGSSRAINLTAGALMFVSGAFGPALLAPATTFLVNRLGGGLIALPSQGVGLIAGAAVYLVAMDLGEYLYHRAQHKIPALWAMHSLHHSDEDYGALTSQRHFWLEPLIKMLTVWLVVSLVFKASPAILTIYGAACVWHVFTHGNLRLGFGAAAFLWNSPQYHRLHHSSDPAHFNRNFAALLPVFDVITGAYSPPARGDHPATGFAPAERPSGPMEAAIWPFRGLKNAPAAIKT